MSLTDFKFFTKESTILFDELGNLLYHSIIGNYLGESRSFHVLEMIFICDNTYECVVIHKTTYVSRTVTFKLNLGGTNEVIIK